MNSKLARTTVAASAVLALALGTAACDDNTKTSTAQQQGNQDNNTIADKFNRAVPYPYRNSDPSSALERENLAKRLLQLNSKGSTGYVYLLAPNTAQVVGYYVISGKVSSTDSAMTSTQVVQSCHSSSSGGGSCAVTDSIGDDGTYGPSEGGDNGVFFFTASGVLVETVMPWIYSSQPLKIYANAPQLDAK